MPKTNFDIKYWEELYSEPDTMDGIGNAKEHVAYIKALFNVDLIDISSIIDFGFGHGKMLKLLLKEFIPYKAAGIEPSEFIFNKVSKQKLTSVKSTKINLFQEDLKTWCYKDRKSHSRFDLGVCMSVFQYIKSSELREIVPILSQRVKYLYLTVPTKEELEKQVSDLNFYDPYALRRSRRFYQGLLKAHFTFISNRLLESKYYFDNNTSLFSDLLYRF